MLRRLIFLCLFSSLCGAVSVSAQTVGQTQPAETAPQSKIVVLTSDRIKEEKISENSDATASRTP